jgi:predicted DNA repair protein MutK
MHFDLQDGCANVLHRTAMATPSLLTLLDDIASLLDDVSTLTNVAAKKTAGVLGDDLALNAEQVAGVPVDRELPVVWAVAKGSAVNKLILVPTALVISAVAPWAIIPLLMVGGAYLCFEGFEKLAHKVLHPKEVAARHVELVQAVVSPAVNMLEFEKEKVKGAIRTDFILSAEIIVISLGVVGTAAFGTRVAALTAIAVIMTVGVYGLVAGIVKLDDAGLWLRKKAGIARFVGTVLVSGAPWLMKGLSVAGTAAMFLVGGGILVHGIPGVEAWLHDFEKRNEFPGSGVIVSNGANAIVGVVAGAVILAVVSGVKRFLPNKAKSGSVAG